MRVPIYQTKNRLITEKLSFLKLYWPSFVLSLLFLFVFDFLASAQTAQQVNKVSITVSDLEQSTRFFENVLSFKKIEEKEVEDEALKRLFGLRASEVKIKQATLQIGQEQIELIEFASPNQGRPIPTDSRSNDLWFQHIAIVVSDMDKAYQMLRDKKVKHVSTAPQTLPDYIPAAAGIKAFYFRDPDEHNLEIIYFPSGKGSPKWQGNTSDSPFIGIDHTALGISDTDQSTEFYEDLLGLKVAGNSENYGPEQEHLNQVFGARLLITGLKAQQGIGVEFLSYIAPPGGRAYPLDSKVNDLWHWHTHIQVANLEQVHQKLLQANYPLISSGMVSLPSSYLGYTKALMVRDPDGHAVLLYEK